VPPVITGKFMQAVLAELRRSNSPDDEVVCERAEEVESSDDRISSRGLEILRILNDVFNGLPAEPDMRIKEYQSARG
jgi:hypothetical protein